MDDAENSVVLGTSESLALELVAELVGTAEGMSDWVEVDIGRIVSAWPELVVPFSGPIVEVGTPL